MVAGSAIGDGFMIFRSGVVWKRVEAHAASRGRWRRRWRFASAEDLGQRHAFAVRRGDSERAGKSVRLVAGEQLEITVCHQPTGAEERGIEIGELAI